MKKLSTLLVVVAAFVAIGCGKDGQQAAAPAAAPAAPAAAPAAPAPGTPAAAAPAAAPAAPSVVADLPNYPGATLVKTEAEARAGYSKSIEAKFTSGDPYDAVKKFYADAIAANGWQITSTAEKPGEVKWFLAKGTSAGKVEVENEHGALKIKLERMDK